MTASPNPRFRHPGTTSPQITPSPEPRANPAPHRPARPARPDEAPPEPVNATLQLDGHSGRGNGRAADVRFRLSLRILVRQLVALGWAPPAGPEPAPANSAARQAPVDTARAPSRPWWPGISRLIATAVPMLVQLGGTSSYCWPGRNAPAMAGFRQNLALCQGGIGNLENMLYLQLCLKTLIGHLGALSSNNVTPPTRASIRPAITSDPWISSHPPMIKRVTETSTLIAPSRILAIRLGVFVLSPEYVTFQPRTFQSLGFLENSTPRSLRTCRTFVWLAYSHRKYPKETTPSARNIHAS